jgi:hypothetical protein
MELSPEVQDMKQAYLRRLRRTLHDKRTTDVKTFLQRAEAIVDYLGEGVNALSLDLVTRYLHVTRLIERIETDSWKGKSVDVASLSRLASRLLAQAKALNALPQPLLPAEPQPVGVTFAEAMHASATRAMTESPPRTLLRSLPPPAAETKAPEPKPLTQPPQLLPEYAPPTPPGTVDVSPNREPQTDAMARMYRAIDGHRTLAEKMKDDLEGL